MRPRVGTLLKWVDFKIPLLIVDINLNPIIRRLLRHYPRVNT